MTASAQTSPTTTGDLLFVIFIMTRTKSAEIDLITAEYRKLFESQRLTSARNDWWRLSPHYSRRVRARITIVQISNGLSVLDCRPAKDESLSLEIATRLGSNAAAYPDKSTEI